MDSRALEEGQDSLDSQVMDSMGIPSDESQEMIQDEGEEGAQSQAKKRPTGWERLKQKNRALERELQNLHATVGDLQSKLQPMQSQNMTENMPAQGNDIEGYIHKAVSLALGHKEEAERKAKEAERMAHVNKQYAELQKHLDNTADKYDDFDDVVRAHDVPFTQHMVDASLLLPRSGAGSAGEVLYKLGKNREELERIKNLHPLDQASEMVKLSHALINGQKEPSQQSEHRHMGGIKSNPMTNNSAISDKTPIGDLRRRMRSNWK